MSPRVAQLIERVKDGVEGKLGHDIVLTLTELSARSNPDQLTVSVADCTISRNGFVIRLSRKGVAAMQILAENNGVVSVRDIKKAVYGDEAKDRSTNVVRVLMNELRLRLLPLDATIVNHHGQGYRLEVQH
jgi:DNA-binding response OmpR family regulator